MTSDDKPIIFVDTTCFARGFKWDDEDWQILLNASKQGDLRIVVSEIVYRERQSQWCDDLVAPAYRVKEAIDKLTSVWNRNHVTRNSSSPYLLAKIEIENFQKDVIAKVKGYAENLTSEHIIEIRHVQEHHTEEVLRKYFLWHGQFDSPHRDRDDKEVRNKRKTHLLDAWIMEEALDLKVRGGTLYVLCHDKKLSETLKNNDIRVFETPKDILSELRRNQEEDISVEPDRRSPVLEPEFAVTENLDNLFNTDLITKVLGYISGLFHSNQWRAKPSKVSEQSH